MATSGSTTYNPTLYSVVKRALRLVGGYQSIGQPRSEQVSDAVETLNMMLKAWQVDGLVWLKQFITVNLVQGQQFYDIGPDSTDVVTDELGTQYTQRPFRVMSATRKFNSSEVTISPLTRDEYVSLTNKSSQGSVTQYYYDAKIGTGRLYVWPTSSNSTDQLIMTAERGIEDMISDLNTFDLPPEWAEAISYGLAYRIAPEYGITGTERDQLQKEAAIMKESIISSCREFVPALFIAGGP